MVESNGSHHPAQRGMGINAWLIRLDIVIFSTIAVQIEIIASHPRRQSGPEKAMSEQIVGTFSTVKE